jgi:hypothetical protein
MLYNTPPRIIPKKYFLQLTLYFIPLFTVFEERTEKEKKIVVNKIKIFKIIKKL